MAGGFSVAAAAGVIGEKLVVGKIGVGESAAFIGASGTAEATTTGRARGRGVTFALFAAGLAADFDFAALDLAVFVAPGFALDAFLSGDGFAAAGFAGFAWSAGLAANAGTLRVSATAHPTSQRGKQPLKVIPSLRALAAVPGRTRKVPPARRIE